MHILNNISKASAQLLFFCQMFGGKCKNVSSKCCCDVCFLYHIHQYQAIGQFIEGEGRTETAVNVGYTVALILLCYLSNLCVPCRYLVYFHV